MTQNGTKKTKAEKRWDRLFYNCPGAWVGATYDGYLEDDGHITVDSEKLLPAIDYMRRRVEIVRTRTSPGPCLEKGVQLIFRWRNRNRDTAPESGPADNS